MPYKPFISKKQVEVPQAVIDMYEELNEKCIKSVLNSLVYVGYFGHRVQPLPIRTKRVLQKDVLKDNK